MNNWKLVLLAMSMAGQSALAANVSYNWNPLKLGAGGFINGLDANGSTIVARTDTYGAYKKVGSGPWTQLVTEKSAIDYLASIWTPQKGVLDIKIAPQTTSKIYMSYDHQFLRSSDGGATFLPANQWFNDYNTHLTDFRYRNNRIALDPSSSAQNVIYYGTWASGLQVSTDGGVNFTNASTGTNGLPSAVGFHCRNSNIMNDPSCATGEREYPGVSGIAFAPSQGQTPEGKTNVIYAFLMSTDANYLTNCDPASPTFNTCSGGLYKTHNGGAGWYRIGIHTWNNAEQKNKPIEQVIQSDVDASGNYYLTAKINNQVRVYRVNTNNSVNDITPSQSPNAPTIGWMTIAASKQTGGRVILSDAYGQMLQSTDGGANWSSMNSTPVGYANDVPWLENLFGGYITVGAVMFDKVNEAYLWISNGFGVWTTESSNSTSWTSVNEGIEQTVTNNIVATTNRVVGGLWDWAIVPFTNPDLYVNSPVAMPGHNVGEILTSWDLENPEGLQDTFVSVTSSHLPSQNNKSGYSTDGGATWTVFSNMPITGTVPRGQIATFANDNNNDIGPIMWLAPHGKGIHYTVDKAATAWKSVTAVYSYDYSGQGGHGAAITSDENFWRDVLDWQSATNQKLSADRGTNSWDKRFYFHHKTQGIFQSVYDAGTQTFYFKCVMPPQWITAGGAVVDDASIIKSVPGKGGHFLFATGSASGSRLFMSENSGWGLTQLNSITSVQAIGFGKALTTNHYPTIFVVGNVGSAFGIWRSTDKGASWDKVMPLQTGCTTVPCVRPLHSRDVITSIDGDKNVFGKIYVGFSGSGFAYGVPTP